MPNRQTSPTAVAEPGDEAVLDVAMALVDSGRVVPGLEVGDDGRPRSCWWPLPSASQRRLVAGLVTDPSPAGQRATARRLAVTVDAVVRARLVASVATIMPRRPGRPTLVEAWAKALVSPDATLAGSFDPAKVAALAGAVETWVRSGAVVSGQVRLCLRIHEPPPGGTRRKPRPWTVELLAQDRDDLSLVVPLAQVWDGTAPFGASALEESLVALARLARLAPELGPFLDQTAPSELAVDDRAILAVLRNRLVALEDAGIGVLLPAWWTSRPRLGLRAKARSASPKAAATPGRVGMDAIISFTWEAALGDRSLTKADLEALARAAGAKQSLVRVRGQWVEIDQDSIAELLAAAGTERTAPADQVLRAGLGLDDLGAPGAVPVVGVDASSIGWLHSLLDGALHGSVQPVTTPEGFCGQLRPYQERGVGWLCFLGRLGLGSCLADDMGLGKTAQLVATILADPAPGPTLVVCPVSVLGNWQRELARFAPGLSVLAHHGATRHGASRGGTGGGTGPAETFAERAARHDVVLTTYSLLARDQEHLAAVHWGRVAFDEAQQVKNPAAAQTRAAGGIWASRRVALTGTPVENRLSELWSIMHLLNPGLLGSQHSFQQRFSVPIEREHDQEATELLRRVTGPFVLRRLKTDRSIITDLPDKIEAFDRSPLTKEQATLYRAVVDDLLDEADEAEGMSRRGIVLAGLLRLKQVCNHPAHFLGDGSALPGRSGKLTRLEELLEEILAEGDKALLFTQFTAWGDRLGPYLHRRFGVETLWLHGRVRRAARDEMVERFQGPDGPPLLLVSLKAGGTGLNLTAASHVIHFDRWWNPAVEDQATDRAYRIGQRRTVLVHKLVSSGTVEERVDELIAAKRELAQRVVGTGEDWLTDLSTEDLRDLVALREEPS
ncbi:MAG TPA: DEAD/DEAH box helicase [Acidimicrobiales bacterium]|jgi:hypothetical protein|nr:DEAD/DEAH box helicase [Acidimicrobiales bacterium]